MRLLFGYVLEAPDTMDNLLFPPLLRLGGFFSLIYLLEYLNPYKARASLPSQGLGISIPERGSVLIKV